MEPDFASKLQAAVASASPQAHQQPAAATGSSGGGGGGAGGDKKAVPPVTKSYDELMQLSIKELKALLNERGVGHSDCLEKGDLARRVVERCSRVTHYV